MKTQLNAILILILLFGCRHENKPTLYLIGDSTMADKEKLYLPERGWGQIFPQLFNDEIFIENHAKNGRSTRSFIYEGRWDSVCAKIQSGDFIIIQFGHNDGSIQKIERYATHKEYEYNLRKFVKEIRQKQAHPILATSIVRRRFGENNTFYDSHGEYPEIARHVASEMDIPLLEMHYLSMNLIKTAGVEASKLYYLHIEVGKNDSLPNGLIDDTHFSEFGAMEFAKIAASEVKIKVPDLAKYLKP